VLTAQITDQTTGHTIYNGPLSALHSVDAGALAAGAGHVFRFSVTMSESNPSIAYERASSTVGYTWTADGVPTTPPGGGGGTGGGGAGGGGGGGGTPPDTRPPAVTIAAKATQKAKLAFVTAKCDEPCTFKATAKISGAKGAKSPKVSMPAGAAAAGAPTKIKFVFDKKSLKKIRRGQLKVTVTGADAAGNRGSAATTIKLKR
jgi:hypothetical protein